MDETLSELGEYIASSSEHAGLSWSMSFGELVVLTSLRCEGFPSRQYL